MDKQLQALTAPPPPRWGVTMTLMWWLVFLLVSQGILALGLFSAYTYSQFNGLSFAHFERTMQIAQNNLALMLWVSLWSNILATPVLWFMVHSKRGAQWRDYMAWRHAPLKSYLTWSCLSILLIMAMSALHEWAQWPTSPFMGDFKGLSQIGLVLAAVVIAAPIVEEWLFRGFVYSGFERSWGAWPAIIASSLLFTVIHMQYNSYELAQLFVLAMVLGMARKYTNSIGVPIVIHAINNALAAIHALWG